MNPTCRTVRRSRKLDVERVTVTNDKGQGRQWDANRHTFCWTRWMKPFNWSAAKNATLMSERGISFEDVVFALQSGGPLDDMVHANRQKYPRQRMFVVRIDDYAWLVPYVENDDAFFLNTIIPSRRATQQYLGGKHE